MGAVQEEKFVGPDWMSLLSTSLARSHGVLLSRLLWPTGILFVATLVMVVGTFLWTSDNANTVSAERQRERLVAAIDERLETYREAFGGLLADAEHNEAALNEIAVKSRGFDGLTLISAASGPRLRGAERDDKSALDRIRPLLEEVLSLRRTEQPPEAANSGTDSVEALKRAIDARLLSDGDHHFAILTASAWRVRMDRADPSDIIATWKRLDSSVLPRMAMLQGLRNARVVPAGGHPPHSAIPLANGRGDAVAYIVWDLDRPGDLMRERLRPLLVAGLCAAMILFGAVAVHFHRTTRNLAETDAVSKQLLGRDPLSGLSNRLLFNERLDRELEKVASRGTGLAVMFIDLDRFKEVNDSYGHQAGDDLIRLVAERLVALLPGHDTLARLGGDEFAIIQTQVTSTANAEALARRILDTLARPFALAHSHVTIGSSIGVALAPEHAGDRETLMRLADTALYQAKSEGRNRTSFFQSHMDETVRMRKVVEDDLRRAIEKDELVLHYQPLYSSDGLKIVGLEALIRWPHPERGMISPTDFIPIAEEKGLVIPLGEWVLRRACEDGKRWPDLRVAVNVSAIQFRHRGFVESVVRILDETGFDPVRLELELTEGVVVGDEDAAEAAMVDLRALGVHLALDDFGTGYSSLIYLRRFAFDKIKIDRSFLESMEATGESAILVHSIVHLGRALGLVVTAEGVETKEQHRFLQALGCHQLQGYLFSKPVPRDEIDRLLSISPLGLPSAA